MNDLLLKLKKEVPEFWEYEEFDNLLTVDFDRLGSFILKLFSNLLESNTISEKENVEKVIIKIFDFLNRMHSSRDNNYLILLNVCIFESLISSNNGYFVAKKYMSDELYNSFLTKFPFSIYKNSWDDSEYYTEEEFDELIKRIASDKE